MLSEQEETINKYKTRLRELGENIASDAEDEENDHVGLLEMSLYGTRDAARNWSSTVEEHLKDRV